MKRYDDATSSLHQALREQQEIEKRSDDLCVDLVKASESLVVLKTEVKDWEKKRSKQERLLREINNVCNNFTFDVYMFVMNTCLEL